MNGSQHYQEGERLLSNASFIGADGPVQRDGSRFEPGEHCALVDRAMAHFAAAQVAATALHAVLPLVGGDCSEVTHWAHAIGVLDEPAEPAEEPMTKPESWPPIAGDLWEDRSGDRWFAHGGTGGRILMVPNHSYAIANQAPPTPDELLDRLESLVLLTRDFKEPPF